MPGVSGRPHGDAFAAGVARVACVEAVMRASLSVVVPVYNERDNLEELIARLVPVLEQTTPEGGFEVILVDDGSTDGSAELLDALHARDGRLKVLHFSRNFGHQAALQAGLEEATGDGVVLIDADLQDRPEMVETFVAHWRDGVDVVYAVRTHRKEGLLKRAAYALFYRTLRRVSQTDIPLDAGDFSLIDRRVVDALVALPEHHRFLRGLRSWVGFRQLGVPCERDPRHGGASKYDLGRLLHLALTGYIGFSTVPLRLATLLGMAAATVGFLLAVWAVASKFLAVESPRGWASTLAVILFVGGAQLLMLGVVGEYLGRVYDEVRRRPVYVLRARLGFEDTGDEEGDEPGSSPPYTVLRR